MARERSTRLTILVLPLILAGGAAAGAQAPADEAKRVTLTGCLQAAPKGDGFVLSDVRPSTAGTRDSGLTSAGAGTSATGAAPSGSVSGDTPTGSTATATSAPTPAVGTAGASASPASPGYNRGEDAAQPADVTAGAAGTVPRPETPEAAPIRKYQVKAGQGVDLRAHTGHTVELEGSLQPTAAAPPEESAAREGRGSATAEPTSEMREPVIEATRVRHVAAGCK
jgi:hypothetical protein